MFHCIPNKKAPHEGLVYDSFLMLSHQRDLINHQLTPWHNFLACLFYDVFKAVNGPLGRLTWSEWGEVWAERAAGEEPLTVIMVTSKQADHRDCAFVCLSKGPLFLCI